MRANPSGEQLHISSGDHEVTIVEVGAGIRSYNVRGREILDGYALTERCTGARGLPLIPWPNRVADGAYTFDGVDYQVPITEPDKYNAIHGFLRWRNWTAREHSADRVVMGTVLHPITGYPYTLDVSVDYTIDRTGLTVRTTATNLGDQPCPYGAGQHPYLTLGTGADPVAGSAYDFRTGARSAPKTSTTPSPTSPAATTAGPGCTSPRRTTGASVSGSTPATRSWRSTPPAPSPEPYWRRGLGVEPMTCAPNAFASGDGLLRLDPGQSAVGTWGIQPG